MKKSEAYARLFELSDKGIDISKPISILAKSADVEESVVKFIYDNINSDLSFLSNLKSKKFYKTLVESTDYTEKAKGVSSFITHLLIEFSNNPDSRSSIVNSINLPMVFDNLKEYTVNNDKYKLDETIDYLKSIFEKSGD